MVPQLGKVDETGLLRLKSANQRLMWKSPAFSLTHWGKKRFTFPQTGRGKGPGIPSESRGKLIKLYLHRLHPDLGDQSLGREDPRNSAFHLLFRGPDVQQDLC